MVVHSVSSWQIAEDELCLHCSTGEASVRVYPNGIIRFCYSRKGLEKHESYILSELPGPTGIEATDEGGRIAAAAGENRIIINKSPFTVSIVNKDGKDIVAGRENFLTLDEKVTAIKFELEKNEHIYGLGQDPMANINQNGHERRVFHQYGHIRRSGNIGIPFFMSSRGYGFFLHTQYPSRFGIGVSRPSEYDRLGILMAEFPEHWPLNSDYADTDAITVLLDEDDIDLFIMPGDYKRILKYYYALTGKPVLLPKWAYGYIQSLCRYRSQDEIIAIAEQMRKANIPADVIVIDWLWFREFGDLTWDERSWPDPAAMFGRLDKLGFNVLMAQHPFISPKSINLETFALKGFLNNVPPGKRLTYDHTNPKAREFWWKKIKPHISEGARGYWADMGEPEEHHPGTISAAGGRDSVHNIYMLLWTLGLYEGQRKDFPCKRFFSLNRAYYPGMQRYGTALWSGDVDSTWEVMKEQAVIGQGVCLSGIPYWSGDTGGFLTVDGFTPELFVRWMQWSVFCPIFRTHGTRPFNEPWSFGKQGEEICRHYIGLRYRLLPYIYSLAHQMYENGEPVMRAMVWEYPDDKKAADSLSQFMFGPYLLAAPVLDKGIREKEVYLPQGKWYNYDTEELYEGGKVYTVSAPLCRIPLFVKAGALIPQYEEPLTNIPWKAGSRITIHAYPGANGSFTLYDDNSDGYSYENGDYYAAEINYDDRAALVSVNPVHLPETGETREFLYDVVIHDAVLKLPSPQLYTDCDMENDGALHVFLNWENGSFDDETELTALLSSNPYWSVRRVNDSFHNSLLYSRRVMFTDEKRAARLGKSGCIRYELFPCGDAMPASFSGNISVKVFNKDNSLAYSREIPLEWGNGGITTWSFCGYYPNPSDSGLYIPYPPEKDIHSPYYIYEDRTLPWVTDNTYRYNCFGYVELRRYGVFENQTNEGIHAVTYAKTNVFSHREQTVLFNVSAETGLRMWANGREILSAKGIIINNKSASIMLHEGWNTLLVKTSVCTEKPYSGREFGFQIIPENEYGIPPDDLLYKA
jgi:alpha-glucosidase (family GH31 glycosyl hydrolase)